MTQENIMGNITFYELRREILIVNCFLIVSIWPKMSSSEGGGASSSLEIDFNISNSLALRVASRLGTVAQHGQKVEIEEL